MTLLTAQDLVKTFEGGDGQPIEVLRGLHLDVRRGEMVAVVGASGAGKSTLLHLLGALDQPTAGTIVLGGTPYAHLSAEGLDRIRAERVGFVFQFHHLLREFTALENVMMPLLIQGVPDGEARARARTVLERVELGQRLAHYPRQLSGGEQQRCAVARAIVHDPAVLLADEPSGNLDQAHSTRLHDLLSTLVRELETGAVVATHNRHLAERADRILLLEDGRLHAATAEEAMS